jgi:hypothetical protein
MLATTEARPTGLYFITEGTTPLSTETWNDVEVTVVYDSLISKIGFAPRFLNDIFNLTAYIIEENENYIFRADALIREELVRYADIRLETLTFPVTITSKIEGSHYIFTVNDLKVADFEFLSIPEGQIMLYAGVGDSCSSATVKEPQGTTWFTNTTDNGIVVKQTEEEDETQQLTLIGKPDTAAKAWKTVSGLNGAYVLSFIGTGMGEVTIDGVLHPLPGDNINYSISANVEGPKDVIIMFSSNSKLTIQEPQLEQGTFATSYIPNRTVDAPAVREESILSFPAVSNFREAQGTIYLSIVPKSQVSTFTVFETDTGEFNLRYADGQLTWTVMGNSLSVPNDLSGPLSIIAKWDGMGTSLSLNGLVESQISTMPTARTPKSLLFTRTNEIGNVVIDDIIIWSAPISDEVIYEEIPSQDSVLLQATFKKAIAGKGVSWFEIPVAPFDSSPILVEKKDGTNMKKISFFDLDTGKYRTYNEELFLYDGNSDYVEVAFDNLNEDFFDLMIRTESGEKIGAPYVIDGKRIWFSLAPTEKDIHNRSPLYVRYQINDSYTVDYNIEAPDGYRIDFSKHDGQEKTVFQEGNRYAEPYKLATMIEMNPIMNQNHEGFLYVTKNVHEVSSFKITVTPEHVPADGGSMSMVLIEPVDKDGNYVPVANLNVSAQHGAIHRIVSTEAGEAQKRSGIYIYQYYPPFFSRTNSPRNIEETLWIIDEDTNIGMQYNFLLRPMSAAHPVPFTEDNARVSGNRAYIFNYLLMYEGMKEEEDTVLFNIIDLNKDGKITWEDIEYLETGVINHLTSGIVTKIKAWEETQ